MFQDPFASLNPRRRIKDIVALPLAAQGTFSRGEIDRRVAQILERVGSRAEMGERMPAQLSGGQRQRAAIARALVLEPRIVICDEPTSALDVSVQAQILNLLADLRRDLGLTYLFISHNLAVVEHVASEVAVMYLGRIVERNETDALFREPRHPYTQALLASVLTPEPGRGVPDVGLGDIMPDPANIPPGCRFHPRCRIAVERCRSVTPVPMVRARRRNGRVPPGMRRASSWMRMESNMRVQFKLGAAIFAAALLGNARGGAEIRRQPAHLDARRAAEHRSLLQQPAHRRGDASPGLGHAGLSQSRHLQDRAAARDRMETARRDHDRVHAAAGREIPRRLSRSPPTTWSTRSTVAADPASKVSTPANYNWIDKAEKTGELSVRVKLKRPTPAALEYFALVLPIYPKAYREKVGPEGYAKAPVGAGPYKMTKVEPGVSIDFERFEDYWAGSPKGKPAIKKTERALRAGRHDRDDRAARAARRLDLEHEPGPVREREQASDT